MNSQPRPLRVLVAEDNEDHRFFIVRALQDAAGSDGLEVEAVRDGAQALDFLYRRGRFSGRPRPHLMLIDLRMPKVGGLEVIEQVKQDPELKSIPISVFSSSDRQEDVEAAYRLGTNSYLRKQTSLAGMRQDIREASAYWSRLVVLPEPPE